MKGYILTFEDFTYQSKSSVPKAENDDENSKDVDTQEETNNNQICVIPNWKRY